MESLPGYDGSPELEQQTTSPFPSFSSPRCESGSVAVKERAKRKARGRRRCEGGSGSRDLLRRVITACGFLDCGFCVH